jgi:hypothetical protein
MPIDGEFAGLPVKQIQPSPVRTNPEIFLRIFIDTKHPVITQAID